MSANQFLLQSKAMVIGFCWIYCLIKVVVTIEYFRKFNRFNFYSVLRSSWHRLVFTDFHQPVMLPTYGEATFLALYGIVFFKIIKKAKTERIKNPPYGDGRYRTHPWATLGQYLRQVRILFVTVLHGYILWELSRCASHLQYQIFRCNIFKMPEPCDKEDGSWFKSAKKECDIERQNTLDWVSI